MRDLPRMRVGELVSAPLELANVALVVTAAALVGGGGPTPGGWTMIGVMAFDIVVMWAAIATIVYEKRAVPDDDGDRYVELAHTRARMLTRFVEWVLLGANASIAATLFLTPGIAMLVTFVAIAGPVVAFLPVLTRVQREMRRIAGTNVPGTDLSKWRAGGLVYWAPDDPAIVVPKRIGIGTTLNMAHPVSWIVLGAAIVVPLLITLLAVA